MEDPDCGCIMIVGYSDLWGYPDLGYGQIVGRSRLWGYLD